MSVGHRLQAYLDKLGHSYRDVERIAKVSRETVRRICNGYDGPTIEYQVKKIVRGYQAAGFDLNEDYLFEGRNPKGDFEWMIGHAGTGQRIAYLSMTIQQRVRLTVTFLGARYPTLCEPERLSVASGLDPKIVERVLTTWERQPPDVETALALARGITRLTEICRNWFRCGWLDTESPSRALVEGAGQACFGGRTAPRTTKVVIDSIKCSPWVC
ncbi:MAG TPA: helix-turn-helix transcriptional regulator [Symbiobacteriaceae bacterium]|jgi:transcriptional regulator with XRE-family HTH domain